MNMDRKYKEAENRTSEKEIFPDAMTGAGHCDNEKETGGSVR